MLENIMLKIADNNPLTPQEREMLVRGVRELVQLTTEYKSKRLENPIIVDPDFRSSPLRVFHCYLATPVAIANNTISLVTFETSRGDISIFDFYQGNKSKIRMDRSQFNIRIDGVLDWVPDADGYRSVFISVHDSDDVQVGVKEISLVEAVEQANIPTRMNFSYTEDIRDIFPNGVYFSMHVKHEAGANLDLESFVMSVSIA